MLERRLRRETAICVMIGVRFCRQSNIRTRWTFNIDKVDISQGKFCPCTSLKLMINNTNLYCKKILMIISILYINDVGGLTGKFFYNFQSTKVITNETISLLISHCSPDHDGRLVGWRTKFSRSVCPEHQHLLLCPFTTSGDIWTQPGRAPPVRGCW